MREDIIFAGFGGQGIMLMGKLLAYSAMNIGRFVTWMPSYGAEVRGGTAHSMVIISDTLIAAPIVREPTICIVMNAPSLQKFEDKMKPKGLLIINKSLIELKERREDIEMLEIPATDIALGLGNLRVANMIMLGALLAKRHILPVNSLIDSLKGIIPENHHQLIPINEEALRKGYDYCSC
jgi:2-oxoglutarate ferredoxin oxidoreductase subunit gamma